MTTLQQDSGRRSDARIWTIFGENRGTGCAAPEPAVVRYLDSQARQLLPPRGGRMPRAMPWTTHDMPDLADKTFVVTGANSGIGWEAARALALKGAHVVMACRNTSKGESAKTDILEQAPDSKITVSALDLADLGSIQAFAKQLETPSLDGLINNAGVMALPRCSTADGFEMQLGTNHLGHFALTGLLLDRLLRTKASRIVTVSSVAHRIGRMNFDDLQGEHSYNRWRAYGQSKLANLLFTHELTRRLDNAGTDTLAVACHPGYASTNLQAVAPKMEGSRFFERVTHLGNTLFAQSAADGALPTLYAATAERMGRGDFIGPSGWMEMGGPPRKTRSKRHARDPKTAARLWEVSEELTRVRFTALTN